jgi:hypothetical protein
MSMEQPLDPSLIEQTKKQIQTLVKEMEALSKSECTPPEFYADFLPKTVAALAAVGGAIWELNEQGQLSLQYQINFQETGLRESEDAQRQHGMLLNQALGKGESLLVPPRSGFEGSEEAGNPTDFILLLSPIKTDLETFAIVEVFQRPGAGPKTQSGYLNFLKKVVGYACDFFKTRSLRHFGDRQTLWTQLEEFTRVIHASLDPRLAAYTVANEGRRLIECDRVSVAIRKGRKCRVDAVSGQDVFDKRSNLVRLMENLSTAVVASEEPLWYTGSTDHMAPQVEDAVQDYIDESHTKALAVLPIFPPLTPEQETDDLEEREKKDPPLGALIVEQIEDVRVTEKMKNRIEVVSEHSRLALNNALEHNSLFMMPVWRTIGKSKVLVKARNIKKTTLVASIILAVVLCMFIVPWDYEMVADGTLEPMEHRNIFVPVDGAEVEKLEVKQGDIVKAGALLCLLKSDLLDQEEIDVEGRIAENESGRSRLTRILSSGGIAPKDRADYEGQLDGLEREWDTLLSEREIYQKKQADLSVYAPIDGIVITWDLADRLENRPLGRGETLMRIANPQPGWEIELLMPDKRMGTIEHWRDEHAGDNQPVEFILATDPKEKFNGSINDDDIHKLAEVRDDAGNTVLITVVPDDQTSLKVRLGEDALRPGASVSAKVYCGKRPLGFVLLHDAFAWVRQNVFFRF